MGMDEWHTPELTEGFGGQINFSVQRFVFGLTDPGIL